MHVRPRQTVTRCVRSTISRKVFVVSRRRDTLRAHVVVIDPEVLDVFPDGAAVNEALRALAPVIRKQRKRRSA
ncbi:MAG: hypothetical protein ACE5JX_18440 [Acidobacteriota bacterium]